MKSRKVVHIAVMFMICVVGLWVTSGCGGCASGCGNCAGKITGCGVKTCLQGCISCGNVSDVFCGGCVDSCNEEVGGR